MKTSTLANLKEEFGPMIPIVEVGKRYLGLSEAESKTRAKARTLPFPAYRCGSQKSPWLVRAEVLAAYLDKREAEDRREWEKVNL